MVLRLIKNRIPIEIKILLIAGLIGSTLSLLLVTIAPGTVVRRSEFAEAYPLLEIAQLSFEYG
jgi:hypothetical protein